MLYFLLKVLKEEIMFLSDIAESKHGKNYNICCYLFFFLDNNDFKQWEMFPTGQMRILNLIYYLRDTIIPSKY